MKNKSIKILSYLGFITSGIISYLLASTLCESTLSYIIAFLMVLVMQSSSFFFMRKTIENKKVGYGLLAIFLFGFSIVGTLSYQFSEQNKAKNDLILNSDSYKQQQEMSQLKKNLVASKEQEIEDIKTLYNSQIEELKKDKESKPSNYITVKDNIQKEINNKQTELANQLNARNTELLTLTNNVNETSIINTQNVEILDTKGYLPLLTTLSKWFDIDLTILTLAIQSLFAIFFELTAIGLHIASNEEVAKPLHAKVTKKVDAPTHAKVTQNLPKTKPILKPVQAKRTIGFNANRIDNVTDIEANKYIETMYNTANDSKCKGYKSISKLAKVSESKGRNVFEYLKATKVIGNIEGRTTILKNRNEVKI